jgi:competence protein ComEA
MKNIKSHFTFLKAERSGILCIIFLIFIVQGIYFYTNPTKTPKLFADAAVAVYQEQVDSLKLLAIEQRKPRIFPFNPNFISDYKGFTLGMSTKEIDRLHEFRTTNKYVNSAKEFQTVTKVSDSLLSVIQPYFKFPEWVTNKKKRKQKYIPYKYKNKSAVITEKINLNKATIEELRKVYGIGEKLSARIIKYKTMLGGFVTESQLDDVYGLKPEVIQKVWKRFYIGKITISKIDLNKATIEELRKVYGIGEKLSARIVKYRTKIDGFVTESQLEDVYGLKPEVIQKVWKRFYLDKSNTYEKSDEVAQKKTDLNKATIEELRKVYGIGEKLSARIVKYRTKIDGFVNESQLDDVYGLKPEVIQNVWKRFYLEKPIITKVNINTCTLEELLKIPYINYELADEIINQRTLREGFKTFDDLTKIPNFPTKKIDIIGLYLLIQ